MKFAELENASDQKVLKFAGRWGPLYPSIGSKAEELSAWREFARFTAALLLACGELAGGANCDPIYWRLLRQYAYGDTLDAVPLDDYLKRHLVASAINNWQNGHKLRQMLLEVVDGTFRFGLVPVGLASTVLVQLARAIAGAPVRSICFGCGRGFSPSRKPTRGIRQYCGREQCKRAARKHAAKDYRQRKKLASEAHRRR